MVWSVIILVKTLADSEDVTVGVSQVRLSQVPPHVGRRPRDFESFRKAVLVHSVHIIHQDT
jgi:hypothetical protein